VLIICLFATTSFRRRLGQEMLDQRVLLGGRSSWTVGFQVIQQWIVVQSCRSCLFHTQGSALTHALQVFSGPSSGRKRSIYSFVHYMPSMTTRGFAFESITRLLWPRRASATTPSARRHWRFLIERNALVHVLQILSGTPSGRKRSICTFVHFLLLSTRMHAFAFGGITTLCWPRLASATTPSARRHWRFHTKGRASLRIPFGTCLPCGSFRVGSISSSRTGGKLSSTLSSRVGSSWSTWTFEGAGLCCSSVGTFRTFLSN
jgi:hypothetical protein